jgi:RNA polymerase sigma-32 factor
MMQYDNLFEQYMREVITYERVSPEREVELSKIILTSKCEKKTEEAVAELIHGNLLLVVHCAREFSKFLGPTTNSINMMDLIAEGNIALMNAARRFDASYSSSEATSRSSTPIKFSTYAYTSIRRAINRALKLSRFIHIPEHHFTYWSKINKIKDTEGDTLTDDSLAASLQIAPSKLTMLKHGHTVKTTALEDLCTDDSSAHWSDKVPCKDMMTPDAEVGLRDLRSFLLQQMKALPDRTCEMLSMMFLSESKPTLNTLSRHFGVSSERCRQICSRGLEMLREQLTQTLTPDHASTEAIFETILLHSDFCEQERMTA